MDKCSSDAEFDSYWDYEAKNKNRNRIRVGRQYQATVPQLLKPGEKDGRKSEDLETLKWKPDKLSDQEVEQYLSMAKGVDLFAKSLDKSRFPDKPENNLQSAIKGLSEFVASHHPCHHDDGCQVPKPSCSGESSKINSAKDWSPSEEELFAQALESCGKNFCAIKKEYLPWKPVRSIIEYYYQGKGEKLRSSAESLAENDEKEKEEPESDACCSQTGNEKVETSASKNDSCFDSTKEFENCKESCKEFFGETVLPKDTEQPAEKDALKKDGILNESESSKEAETTAEPETTKRPEPMTESEVFLENSDDYVRGALNPEIKVSKAEDSSAILSTVGSLKFFLGGRLVLKLNAQQDYESGTKCQWVQSDELPNHSSTVRRVKHKRKSVQEGSIALSVERPKYTKKSTDSEMHNSDCGSILVKKLKLNSDYDFTEGEAHTPLLCSSSWTPPVADGQESVEMDDCSSKTSEGYISPVLPNARYAKVDIKRDLTEHLSCINDCNDEQKWDPGMCPVKPELKPESRASSIQSESSYADDSASKNVFPEAGKYQCEDDAVYNQDVLNHKSALSHNKYCVKSPGYLSQSSHSNSPFPKQWNKLSNVPHHDKPKTLSYSTNSPKLVLDSKSSIKDIPLDLTSTTSESLPDHPNVINSGKEVSKTVIKSECIDNCMPSTKCETQPSIIDSSAKSSNCGLHFDNNGSLGVKLKNESCCHEVRTIKSEETQCDGVKKESCKCSPCKTHSGDAGHLSYSYCNLPLQCALHKCSKDYSLEEHLCNKNDNGNNKDSDSDYIFHEVDDNLCKKNSVWCNKTGSYLQFYPQCYPYYLAYGMTSSPVAESVVAEVPLDLSSGNENIKEKNSISDSLPEEVATQNSSDAVEHGMLYQLLQNKTSK